MSVYNAIFCNYHLDLSIFKKIFEIEDLIKKKNCLFQNIYFEHFSEYFEGKILT